MSLLDEAQQAMTTKGTTCTVTSLLQSLSPSEQAELTEALASSVQSSALSRALANRGHRIAGQTINRHRRGECQCR
jgi:3-methyladenine DNA glycosylase Tag